MATLLFDYKKMLECLSFMEINIYDLDETVLKKSYRILAKKYHPDLTLDYYEKQKRTRQFQELSNCYEYLVFCLQYRYLWEDKINMVSNNDYSRSDNDLIKCYQEILNRLDKLISSLNICLKGNCNNVIKYVISNLLNVIEDLKMKTKKIDVIFDYGTLANYCDLMELFIDKVLNIKLSSIEFDINKNNYVGNSLDSFFRVKCEVCYLEKLLLYRVILRIIDFINIEGKYVDISQYKEKVSKYLEIIDEITDSIYSFKWILVLPNVKMDIVYNEINRLKKKL